MHFIRMGLSLAVRQWEQGIALMPLFLTYMDYKNEV